MSEDEKVDELEPEKYKACLVLNFEVEVKPGVDLTEILKELNSQMIPAINLGLSNENYEKRVDTASQLLQAYTQFLTSGDFIIWEPGKEH